MLANTQRRIPRLDIMHQKALELTPTSVFIDFNLHYLIKIGN